MLTTKDGGDFQPDSEGPNRDSHRGRSPNPTDVDRRPPGPQNRELGPHGVNNLAGQHKSEFADGKMPSTEGI